VVSHTLTKFYSINFFINLFLSFKYQFKGYILCLNMNNNININYVEYNDSVDNQDNRYNRYNREHPEPDNDLFLSFDNPDYLNNNIETITKRDNNNGNDDSDNDTIKNDHENDNDHILNYIEYPKNQQKPKIQNSNYYSQPKDDIYHSESNINPYLDHLFENKNKNKNKNETLNQIYNDLDDTKTHLRNNIDSLLERDVKISNIEEKSELLLGQSDNFKKRSKHLKLTMCQKYSLHIISMISLIVIIITLILILVKS